MCAVATGPPCGPMAEASDTAEVYAALNLRHLDGAEKGHWGRQAIALLLSAGRLACCSCADKGLGMSS